MDNTRYPTEEPFDLYGGDHNNQLYSNRPYSYIPAETNINPEVLYRDHSSYYHHQYERVPEEHRAHFCRKPHRCHLNICIDSVQEPSKLSQQPTMERSISEPETRTKKTKAKPTKKAPSKEVSQQKPEKPKSKAKPSPEPKEDTTSEPVPTSCKENSRPCSQGTRSEQYISCCSSCCVSPRCSCCGSSCSHKHRKSSKNCEISSANCEDEDPHGEFFDVIRESMEEAIKKAFDGVFGRYFACCLSKIDSLACRIERTEYLLKKMHKDLKYRICVLDRSKSQQFQYLCEKMKKEKPSKCSSEPQQRCKPKCQPPQNQCEPKQSSSSDDNNCRRNVTRSSCKSKCGNNFKSVKSQYWNCGGQQSDNSGKCKNQSSGGSYQSGQSCDEVIINETDLTGSEPKSTKSKTSKLGNKEKMRRKRSGSSDGVSIASKKKNRVII